MDISALDATSRNRNLKKQIVFSFLLKSLGILSGLAVIPVTLNILGSEQYGIWITILSILTWIISFDIGIGNGLRNKLAASLAAGDIDDACRYISTAYFSLSVIGMVLIFIASIIIPFLNWNTIFNTDSITNEYLVKTMLVVIIPVLINFVIVIINQVLNAFQQSSLSNLVLILQNAFFLLMLWTFPVSMSLFNVAMLYSASLILSSTVITIAFYSRYPQYLPAIRWIDRTKIKEILSLGGAFFIIQLSTLFMFSTSSFLIIQLLSAEDVSTYNVTFRLFSVVTIGFNIILTPFWSAFTEASKKRDITWISNGLTKLKRTLLLVTGASIFLVIFHQGILDVWVGDNKVVPGWLLTVLMALYAFILNYSNIYSYYLNGIGQIKFQSIIAVIQAIIIIPVCLALTSVFHMGLSGIILGMIISMLPFAALGPAIANKNLKVS
jgi:O-antigen/teichoic acid export membrane protein